MRESDPVYSQDLVWLALPSGLTSSIQTAIYASQFQFLTISQSSVFCAASLKRYSSDEGGRLLSVFDLRAATNDLFFKLTD